MKELTIAALLALAGCTDPAPGGSSAEVTTMAQPVAQATATQETERAEKRRQAREICKSFEELASTSMEARQAGVAMSRVLEIYSAEDGTLDETVEAIVTGAYERPRMSSESYQSRYVVDYGNETFLTCMKNIPLNQ